MPTLQLRIVVPYKLELREGSYPTKRTGDEVQVGGFAPLEDFSANTSLGAHFNHEDTDSYNIIEHHRNQDVDRLLGRVNRLLRWYRSVSRRADVLELTRALASPFYFAFVGPQAVYDWVKPLSFVGTDPQPAKLSIEQKSQLVRDGLASGQDPDVADLFLLDAERALQQGRFREAVLFCWSTIDSVFNRKYDALVAKALDGEWAKARDFFTGVDFGLKNKMTAALYLVANRSLFRQPGDFWENLSTSYGKRNDIIHRGQNAHEDDARLAIAVAQQVVEIMNEIAAS